MPPPPFSAERALYGHGAQSCPPTHLTPSSTIFVDSAGRVHESRRESRDSLDVEFNLRRLDYIHDLLWWAGRPVPARPLHHQLVKGRNILITEQIDMHLVWDVSKVFLKPLPAHLLGYRFWDIDLRERHDLHRSAAGFLLSYTWLIRHESDLRIAIKYGLIPSSVSMQSWHDFVSSFLDHIDPNSLHQVDRRFIYGELRLNRLNQIYRLAPRFRFQHIVFGYGLYAVTYGSFLQRKFGWLLVAFAYTAIVLNALQVGLATPGIQSSQSFGAVAYYFSVSAILVSITAAAIALHLYLVLFIYHFVLAVLSGKSRRRERDRALKMIQSRSP